LSFETNVRKRNIRQRCEISNKSFGFPSGSFQWVESIKDKVRASENTTGTNDLWLTKDGLEAEEGLTDANKASDAGQRARLRAEAIMFHCRSMKSSGSFIKNTTPPPK